jgi:hypothetical protein
VAEQQVGTFTLLPWVRTGVSAAQLAQDTLTASLPARARLAIELGLGSDTVSVPTQILGPGDVIGIDQHQVVRTDPRPWSANVESNYLASVEFARPDFPWLFTPASADGQNRLRPWLCLIMVRRQDGVSMAMDGTRPLPTLSIEPPAVPSIELPDLAESFAWAHAQMLGTATSLAEAPSDFTRSRLVCPRRLQPNASYIACVVPTFEVGRKAGLGLAITQDDQSSLAPAWTGQETAIQLPVYFQWEFATGQVGDFHSLVAKIKVRQLPATVGIRPMSVANADPDLPTIPADSPDGVLGLEGALMSLQTQRHGFSNGFGPPFRTSLRGRLMPPATGTADPLVTPPIYGARHANQIAVPDDNSEPYWLRELNLDPRYRAVAAFGTSVIQAEQEALMAAAWDQVGEVQRANQLLRQAQLLRSANQSVYVNRLQRLPDFAAVQVTRAVHARVLGGDGGTVQRTMAITLATGAVSPAFRRIFRPRGPLGRRVLSPEQQVVRPVLSKMGLGTITTFVLPPSGGLVTFDDAEARFVNTSGGRDSPVQVSASQMAQLPVATVTPRPVFLIRPPQLPGFPPPPVTPFAFVPADSPEAARLRAAFIAHQTLIAPKVVPIFVPVRPLVGELNATIMASLEPGATSTARVSSLVRYSGPRVAGDPLEPIMAAPQFPTPMFAPLRDLSRDLLIPGLDAVPDNTISPLQTNPQFVEAYMVGLNHEFARELLWRDYPTDQRGTYFSQFWETSAQSGSAPDIPPIHTWTPTNHLGQNLAAGSHGQLVLLMRAELLRRYPNAAVYAVRAILRSGEMRPRPGTEEMYPDFRGNLDPDLVFLGFGLTADQARGSATDPGWFFIIQQPPSEPRFGVGAGAQTDDATYLHPTGDAAVTAAALLQRPVRVAIHASALLS